MGIWYDTSIQIDNVVVYWDCMSECENRVVTVRNYDGMNYTESKKSYDKMKKDCYGMMATSVIGCRCSYIMANCV